MATLGWDPVVCDELWDVITDSCAHIVFDEMTSWQLNLLCDEKKQLKVNSGSDL